MKKLAVSIMIIASLLSGCSSSTSSQLSNKNIEVAEVNQFNKTKLNSKNNNFEYQSFNSFNSNIKENNGKLTLGAMVDFALVDYEKDTVNKIDLKKTSQDFLGINDAISSTIHFIEDGKVYYSATILSNNYINKNYSGIYTMDIESREIEKILDIDCSAGYFIKADDSYYLFGSQIKFGNKNGSGSESILAPGHYRFSLKGKMLNDYSKLGQIKYLSQEDGKLYYLTFDNMLYSAKKNGKSSKLLYDLSGRDIPGAFIVKDSKIYIIETYDHKVIERSSGPIVQIPLSSILMIDGKSEELFTIKDGSKSIYQIVTTSNDVYFSAREIDNKLINQISNSKENLTKNIELKSPSLYKINNEKAVEKILTIKDIEITAGEDKVYYWDSGEIDSNKLVERLKNKELTIGVYQE